MRVQMHVIDLKMTFKDVIPAGSPLTSAVTGSSRNPGFPVKTGIYFLTLDSRSTDCGNDDRR
ncbi:MAG: hypothetical protein AABZ36_01220 [Nitrospirota bacterium]